MGEKIEAVVGFMDFLDKISIPGHLADIDRSPTHDILIQAETEGWFPDLSGGIGDVIKNTVIDAITDPQTYINKGAALITEAMGPAGATLIGAINERSEADNSHAMGAIAASNAGVPGYDVKKTEAGDGYIIVDASDPTNVAVYTAKATDSGGLNPVTMVRYVEDNPALKSIYGESVRSAVAGALQERNSVTDDQFMDKFSNFMNDKYPVDLSHNLQDDQVCDFLGPNCDDPNATKLAEIDIPSSPPSSLDAFMTAGLAQNPEPVANNPSAPQITTPNVASAFT